MKKILSHWDTIVVFFFALLGVFVSDNWQAIKTGSDQVIAHALLHYQRLAIAIVVSFAVTLFDETGPHKKRRNQREPDEMMLVRANAKKLNIRKRIVYGFAQGMMWSQIAGGIL